MVDVVSPAVRSRMMAGIQGKDTKPELRLRKFLHRAGFRYRLHDKNLPGKPDLTFPQYRTVIFVHGCFWHQHAGCRYATRPSNNSEFWSNKLKANTERDARHISRLIEMGWHVITIWECGLRGKDAETNLEWLPLAIKLQADTTIDWPSVTTG